MEAGKLTVEVSVSSDRSVYEMFDVVQDLDNLIALIPPSDIAHARRIKRKIVNKLAGWIDGEEV